MIPAGRYKAQLTHATPGCNRNGKDYVQVVFRVLDGEHAGADIQNRWYLCTDTNARITLANLHTAGVDVGRGDLRLALDKFTPATVVIKTEHDTREGMTRLVVRYVDALDGSSHRGALPTLTDAESRAMDARWRHIMREFPLLKSDDDVPF